MQDDVERVARAIFESDGQSWSEVGTAKSWYLDAARAAMAATREIDAEALRKPAIGFVDHLDVADWLQQRAKDVTDAHRIAAGAHKQEQ
jgi:hypothetical protein